MSLQFCTGGQSLPEFFHTMRRQFTSAEWKFITAPPTEKQQLAMFYRFWVSVLSGTVLVCMYVSMYVCSMYVLFVVNALVLRLSCCTVFKGEFHQG